MKFDIVRAWKSAEYRQSLSAQEQALLPENPAGSLELSDADLEAVNGACGNGGGNGGGGNGGGNTTAFFVNSNAQASLLGPLLTGLCLNSAASFLSCNSNSFGC